MFDASRRTAIALESSWSGIVWSPDDMDIPGITNTANKYQAKQDFNGKANTLAIKAYDSTLSSHPAAKYAYEYKTTGTNAGWYLPALGELNTVYSNMDYMNYALSLVGKEDIPTVNHWSSSVISDYQAWGLSFDSGLVSTFNKYYDYYVRPVLAF